MVLWSKKHISVLVAGLFIVLILAQGCGLFNLTDSLLRDAQLSWQINTPQSSPVLLIENRQSTAPTSAQIVQILTVLGDLKPSDLVVLTTDANQYKVLQSQPNSHKNVQLWLPAQPIFRIQGENLGHWELAQLGDPRHGIICPPLLSYGVHRQLPSPLQADLPQCFEILLAAAKLNKPIHETTINFAYGDQHIARLSIQNVLEGTLPKTLVAGRVVILALDPAATSQGVSLPESIEKNGISNARWHALALDALIQQHILVALPLWLDGIILALLFAVILFGFQWLTARAAVLVHLAIIFCILLLGWLLSYYLDRGLPLTLLISGSIFAAFSSDQIRRNKEEATLLQAIHLLRLSLHSHLKSPDFYADAQPWQQIIVFMNQFFNLKRSIFLERVPGDYRVREIASLHCRIQDIDEQRRDYEREPYSLAIKQEQPLALTRTFLKQNEAGERQFLTPLIFSDEVLGFWAFSTSSAEIVEGRVMKAIHQFAEEIGELLFHRQEWQISQQKESRWWQRMAQFDVGINIHRQLQQWLRLALKRSDALQEFFHHQNSAVIAYNLFGHVTQTNRRLDALAAEWKISFFNMTAVDVLTTLCQIEPHQARMIMQRATFRKKSLALQIKFPESARGALLEVKPVLAQSLLSEMDDRANPFDIQALLLEIHDNRRHITTAKQVLNVIDATSHQIRNSLEAAGLIKTILFSKLTGLEQDLLKKLDKHLELSNQELNQIKQNVADLFNNDDASLLLISFTATLEESLQRQTTTLQMRRITVTRNFPYLIPLVWGAPALLAEALDDILTVVCGDAVNGSKLLLDVAIEERDGANWVRLRLKNEGYGVPQENLTQADHNESLVIEQPYDRIKHYHEPRVSEWGGRLQLESTLGSGFVITIELKSDF